MYGREQRIQKPSAKKLSVATDALLGGVLVAGIHVAVTATKAVALSPFRPPAIGFTCFIFYLHRTVGFGRRRRRPEQQPRATPAFAFLQERQGKAGRLLLLGAERHRPSTGDFWKLAREIKVVICRSQ